MFMIEGAECQCGKKVASRRRKCPDCKGTMKYAEFEDIGTIVTHTTLHTPSEGFEGPMRLCMMELSGGARLLCQFRGEKEPAIGDKVRAKKEDDLYFCEPDL
jgi:uncharacterized OB-fold protein